MIYLTQPKEAILMIEISSDTIRLIDCYKKHKHMTEPRIDEYMFVFY